MSERPAYRHPAIELLTFPRWDAACGWLHGKTTDIAPRWRLDGIMAMLDDRKAVGAAIRLLIENLYSGATVETGRLALAWSMLTVDPSKPESFSSVLPQLQHALDTADLDEPADAELRDVIRIWWRAAEGEFIGERRSIFAIADLETRPEGDPIMQHPTREPEIARWFASPPGGERGVVRIAGRDVPTLVVMPKARASKLNNFHAAYKDLVDSPLPLVVVRDVAMIRAALHAEFPHATAAVDLLLRDLREGKPFRISPVVLVSQPGVGKSRLVRRVADLARQHVLRFDAASSTDAVGFSGSAKSWSNTEPCVPLRAIAQSKTGNPIVLVDEIEKASGHARASGRLHDALLAYLDRETSARYRDQSTDCVIDLSMISFVATANSIENLPSPLRDRLRVIKVPSPTLAHLAPLAAQVMRDLAIEDEARAHDGPLADDELDVIGKAWAKAGFSMRKLQAIVRATLEARDSYAPRH